MSIVQHIIDNYLACDQTKLSEQHARELWAMMPSYERQTILEQLIIPAEGKKEKKDKIRLEQAVKTTKEELKEKEKDLSDAKGFGITALWSEDKNVTKLQKKVKNTKVYLSHLEARLKYTNRVLAFEEGEELFNDKVQAFRKQVNKDPFCKKVFELIDETVREWNEKKQNEIIEMLGNTTRQTEEFEKLRKWYMTDKSVSYMDIKAKALEYEIKTSITKDDVIQNDVEGIRELEVAKRAEKELKKFEKKYGKSMIQYVLSMFKTNKPDPRKIGDNCNWVNIDINYYQKKKATDFESKSSCCEPLFVLGHNTESEKMWKDPSVSSMRFFTIPYLNQRNSESKHFCFDCVALRDYILFEIVSKIKVNGSKKFSWEAFEDKELNKRYNKWTSEDGITFTEIEFSQLMTAIEKDESMFSGVIENPAFPQSNGQATEFFSPKELYNALNYFTQWQKFHCEFRHGKIDLELVKEFEDQKSYKKEGIYSMFGSVYDFFAGQITSLLSRLEQFWFYRLIRKITDTIGCMFGVIALGFNIMTIPGAVAGIPATLASIGAFIATWWAWLLIGIAGLVYATWRQVRPASEYGTETTAWRRWLNAFGKLLSSALHFVFKLFGFTAYAIKDFVNYLLGGIGNNNISARSFDIKTYTIEQWDNDKWPLLQKIKGFVDGIIEKFTINISGTAPFASTADIPSMCYGGLAFANVANVLCKWNNNSKKDCDVQEEKMSLVLNNTRTAYLFTSLMTSMANWSPVAPPIGTSWFIASYGCASAWRRWNNKEQKEDEPKPTKQCYRIATSAVNEEQKKLRNEKKRGHQSKFSMST
jgi:hypothetical protein